MFSIFHLFSSNVNFVKLILTDPHLSLGFENYEE